MLRSDRQRTREPLLRPDTGTCSSSLPTVPEAIYVLQRKNFPNNQTNGKQTFKGDIVNRHGALHDTLH